jgi:predicted benzoate:H+ symporter BenE
VLAQGALSLWLSLKHKTPLLFAMVCHPGAALLVASGTADFSTALGAFLFAALLGLILALIQGLSSGYAFNPASPSECFASCCVIAVGNR